MKRFALIAVLIGVAAAVVLIAGGDRTTRPMPVVEGFQAPDFNLTDLQGRPWSLSAMKDTLVFINFWATWCDPCREEMPSIENLHKMTSGNPRFRILSILYNDDPEKARSFMKEFKYTFPVLIDPGGATARGYGLTGVPETFWVGVDGLVVKKMIGPTRWDSPAYMDEIATILNK